MSKALGLALLLTGMAVAQAPKTVYFDVYPPEARLQIHSGARADDYPINQEVPLHASGHLNLVISCPGWKTSRDGVLALDLGERWPKDGPKRLEPDSIGAHLRVLPLWPLAFLVLAGPLVMMARQRRAAPAPVFEGTMVAGIPWDLPPGLQIDRYKIWEKLGEGASGVVYKVTNEAGEGLALKLLKPQQMHNVETLERFRREMMTLRDLKHPNIPFLADLGEFRGMSYLVMELLGPTTLLDKLKAGPLPLPQALDVLRQLAGAVAFCHKQGVLHRDIKPENVIWGDGQRVRLTDFGLARHHEAATMTQEGTILGTPCYMAPEIVQGEGTSFASDQYSLGCLAYHLVAGRPPFEADNPMVVLMHHIEKNPPPLANVPQPLCDLIFTMLRKRPEHRLRSVDVLVQRLAKIVL